ncbi:hypothetical protein QTI66_14390 [Variovorax sp. J22R133]|uniref:DUF6622 family protein n=1 Tax=Variovorax brevis TaxID=3053503 RepID=UPI002578EF44|nr:DUF6622 family protein [Variovorax sp. J22R133]MDM0113343.1 hypothetical protein [Variovorax sp. J22R133]
MFLHFVGSRWKASAPAGTVRHIAFRHIFSTAFKEYLMLIQIFLHTPKWVFVLFGVLLWLGSKQLLGGRVGLGRVTILPVAMTALSFFGVISAFGDSPAALAAWAVAAAALVAIVLQRPLPPTTRFDAATRSFRVAGTAVPLVLMMGIFFTKYAVGVTLAMHPQLAHQFNFALGISALYGAFSGIFMARSLRMWKLAIRSDRADAAGYRPVAAD